MKGGEQIMAILTKEMQDDIIMRTSTAGRAYRS
jgi:hypothetical protein